MTPPEMLGGFKVLRDLVRIPIVSRIDTKGFPGEFFRAVAGAKINLPYLTLVRDRDAWGLNIMVEASDEARLAALIRETLGKASKPGARSVILSLFPHQNDPKITGALFEAFGREGLGLEALANSPAAISVVLKEESLSTASKALFGPFRFSAYRTPDDWKLAQKGKETLFKEVVASYQEQRPKIYGLKYRVKQTLLHVRLSSGDIAPFGTTLKAFADLGLDLTFLATAPCPQKGKGNVFFCLPGDDTDHYRALIRRHAPGVDIAQGLPAALFSMTGPHFGDRYGIASELMDCLDKRGVSLLGLNCTIASIKGVVPAHQIDAAVEAINGVFEVPAVIRKD